METRSARTPLPRPPVPRGRPVAEHHRRLDRHRRCLCTGRRGLAHLPAIRSAPVPGTGAEIPRRHRADDRCHAAIPVPRRALSFRHPWTWPP